MIFDFDPGTGNLNPIVKYHKAIGVQLSLSTLEVKSRLFGGCTMMVLDEKCF